MEKKDLKLIAFNLPQFHVIPENNKWWGDGFTEWVNVKKSIPQYKNHNQPRVPLNENYYNLNNVDTLMWQMDLAKKYGLYGFAYYHYWFDGKLLLEKPVEKLLEFEKPIKFCLCWANEPWTKAWDGGEKEIIMPQRYGGKEDWKKHFQYLLPFFKDSQYILVDNKPVFIIYRLNNIEQKDEMIHYWDQLCIDEGFNGIYVIEENNSFQDKKASVYSQATLDFEPMNTVTFHRSFFNKVRNRIYKIFFNKKHNCNLNILNYNYVWKLILKKNIKVPYKNYLGGFVDWDNSPRRGKDAKIFVNSSPTAFKKYFNKLVSKCVKNDSDFLFLNAWNEWAEGAYLEPDEKNKYGYLEAIQDVMNGCKTK